MILHRDDTRLVVDKPHGLAADDAAAWLRLHLGLEGAPAAVLDADASGALPLWLGEPAEGRLAVVTYVLLADADRSAGLEDEFRREDPPDEGGGDGPAGPARTLFQKLDTREVAGRPVTAWRAVAAAPAPEQVRRHAAAAGIPVLGDTGRGGAPWPRLALHAAEARWPDVAPAAAPEPNSFSSQTPEALAMACALERRGDWPAAVSDAWRCVHRDEIPGLPAAVDIYGAWLCATWYDEHTAPEDAEAALRPLLGGLTTQLRTKGAVVRLHRRNPHRRGLVAETLTVGDAPPDTFTVTEHGLRYEVNLTRTQHPGLFLDQRDTRRRVALAAAGARLANLFAFTCSFSVAAAAAGCEVVFSVDTAKACLETGKANFARNGLTESGRGKFIRQDARRWLERQERRRDERPDDWRPLDLAVCDPPVFAAGKEGDAFAVADEWPRLAEAVAGLLRPGGRAVFANNHRGGDHERYREQLAEHFARVEELPQPLDFPVLPGGERHVRTFWCET